MTKPVYISENLLDPAVLVLSYGKDHRKFARHVTLHSFCKNRLSADVEVLYIDHSMMSKDKMTPLSVNDMPEVRLERLKAAVPNYKMVTFGLDLNYAKQYNMQIIAHLYNYLGEGKRVRAVITSSNILRTVRESYPEDAFQLQDFLLDSGIEFR